MKILSAREQIENKIKELNVAIEVAKDELLKASSRKRKKENWGYISLIFEPHWLLTLREKEKEIGLNLLYEYLNILFEKRNKFND